MNWIDAKVELPTIDGMLVVVYDPENTMPVWPATWDAQNNCFAAGGGWFEVDEVTHWAPLPTPPKG